MSRGPVVFEHTTVIRLATEQKELIRLGALATGESVGMFIRRSALKEAAKEIRKLKQAA